MTEQSVHLQTSTGETVVDWPSTLARLDEALRSRTTPIGMKLFLLMALTPAQLVTAIDGMEALSRNGLRYPIPPYGIQSDARAGLGAGY